MTAFADHGAGGNGEPLAIMLRAVLIVVFSLDDTASPERRTGPERGLDGGRDKLRGLRVDDVPAEQDAADHVPGLRGRAGRADGGGGDRWHRARSHPGPAGETVLAGCWTRGFAALYDDHLAARRPVRARW